MCVCDCACVIVRVIVSRFFSFLSDLDDFIHDAVDRQISVVGTLRYVTLRYVSFERQVVCHQDRFKRRNE